MIDTNYVHTQTHFNNEKNRNYTYPTTIIHQELFAIYIYIEFL